MENPWKKNQTIPMSVQALITDARKANCWIYHTITRKYYTAEEFESQWQSLFHERRSTDNKKEFLIKTPLAAIKERTRWVERANEELQLIMNKLEGWDANWKQTKR